MFGSGPRARSGGAERETRKRGLVPAVHPPPVRGATERAHVCERSCMHARVRPPEARAPGLSPKPASVTVRSSNPRRGPHDPGLDPKGPGPELCRRRPAAGLGVSHANAGRGRRI